MASKVYFTKTITPEKVLDMYKFLGKELNGRIAVKVHSGEDGNQNYLHPEFWQPVIEHVGGTVVECNTAYDGARNTSEKHKVLLKKHKWTDLFDVDLMDETGPDIEIPVPAGSVHLKSDIVGKHLNDYDSMLVLAHFKGHPMGGFGGALKQLSIGVASSAGKCSIHSSGRFTNKDDQYTMWDKLPPQDHFLESMAEAAGAVVDHFKGNMVFINVMKNLSVDCDCCAVAEDPCMADVGILVSLDPVAIDQACMDLVYASDDPGRDHFLQRVESRNGIHTIEAAALLGVGSREYELIEV
ncbi:MAG: DUF362 domain-containing protein [Clostridiales bacterium]|nr:DUF362 domain-containing protein [Clostridiales bacterium]